MLGRCVTVCALGTVLALGGCSTSPGVKPLKGAGAGAGSGAGAANALGSSDLGASQSSLKRFQQGTLGGSEAKSPLADIHFDYDDYTVRSQDGAILQANARWLDKRPALHIQVEGHCDERGSEEYNIALGARRAQAARSYLITLGVGSSRISTISYGKELPLCVEHDEGCWSKNRRAHFVITQ